MPIPDFQSIMLPLLKYSVDKAEHSLKEATDFISKEFHLDECEKRKLVPSGKRTVVANNVGWAKTYLIKAGLLEATKRGHFKITERGTNVLSKNPREINSKYLEKFPEFIEFKNLRNLLVPSRDK